MRLRLASYLSETLQPLYVSVVQHLEARLGCQVSFTATYDFDRLADFDLAFICGLVYVELRRKGIEVVPLVAPVPSPARYDGSPRYFSDVIVRRDIEARSVEELGGCRWMFNDPDSHSGYLAALDRVVALGGGLSWFGSFQASGAHTRSIDAVRSGQCEASAIDSHLLDVLRGADPELDAELVVIESIGPAPIQPLVALPHVSAEARARVVSVLMTHPAHPLMKVSGFAVVDDAHYDDIRRKLDRVTAQLGWPLRRAQNSSAR